ncbi:MAG: nuclear transport factor 2 family protein [Pikeienuella sp.]|uniref:nuclear transport factor 2 family protein n=1 Tax=Pikeienuella sp. TaxID=2831957 RepID=UPI00391ACCDF
MLDDSALAEVEAAAVAYCVALHEGDVAGLEALFHPRANLYAAQNGALIENSRQVFLDRAKARGAMPGAPDYAIHAVRSEGPEMAHVTLSVALPPRRFTDYLNFLKLDGRWVVISKVFRVAEGPEL